MVKLEKTYSFEGPNGKVTLLDLFESRRQLIIYHFMFDPAWEKGCPGCTGYVERDRRPVDARQAQHQLRDGFARAARQARRLQEAKGWKWPWYSSFGSDFNRDFRATNDKGEAHGLSVFFRVDDDIFHTYSTYQRGTESLTDAYALLDRTPYGRQEDFEDSPPGWPQKPTYG